jgi:hypothetical protein
MYIFDPDKMKLQIGCGKEITVNCVFGLPNASVDPPLVTDTIRSEGAEIRKELSRKLYGVKKSYNCYSLCPLIYVAVGVRATSLTRFIQNMCNICISK